jgi:hypothetical protein
MRSRFYGCALFSLLCLTACADDPSSLTVRVITGLVPGPEFRTVQTTILDGATVSTVSTSLATAEAMALFGNDYARGHNVSTFAVSDGTYRVRVRLLRPNGALLVERIVALTLAGNAVLPVHITRDCVGVECPTPGGSAEFSSCLAGRCVDPRCSPVTPEYCPTIAFCNDATSCGETSSCATQLCTEGVCTPSAIEASCEDTEWCNPEKFAGCEPLEIDPISGIPCGTVCFEPGFPCRFGYWHCSETAPSFCDALALRPLGYLCGEGLECDGRGACLPHVEGPGFSLVPATGLITTELAGTATFSVALRAAPTSEVTVSLASNDLTEGSVMPTSLTFTSDNWNVAQVVTVTGADDPYVDANKPYTITTSPAISADADYNGLNPADVSVVNNDDDVSPYELEGYIKASNTDARDQFGNAVALSADGNTLAVAAHYEGSNATGIGGNQADNSAREAGATYVYVRAGTTWTQQAYVKASNSGTNLRFGTTIALSADGNRMAVGAEQEGGFAGAVYVFLRIGTTWTEEAYIKAQTPEFNDVFGRALALSLDGATLAVGAPSDSSNATGIDGDDTNMLADDAGAVYVFTRAGSVWTQEAYIKASNTQRDDHFGGSVALSGDGSTLAAAAPAEASNATGIGGDQLNDLAPYSGAVYLFARAAGVWSQQAYIKTSNSESGDSVFSVSLSSDGDTLAVGAINEDSGATGVDGNQSDNSVVDSGAVYVFARAGMTWAQTAYLKTWNVGGIDQFGSYVVLSSDGDSLAASCGSEDGSARVANGEPDNAAEGAGAVYLYRRTGGLWSQAAYLKASNAEAGDGFGGRIGLSSDGSTVAIGATHEASNATGVGGDQSDNSLEYPGAVYVFSEVP